MALTKVTYSMIDGASINVQDFGAVGDWNGTTGTDNTAAIQLAINNANGLPIFFPAGNYRTTAPLIPTNTSKFVGENGATGAFAGFVSRITYDPPAVTKSTLSANINTTVTTLSLANASAFPSSGIVYLSTVNGEYVKYTGKSGNDLTGCTRGYWGGTGATSGVTPSGVGESYLAGTAVKLLQPAFIADGVFSGTIQNLGIYRAGFVDSSTGWTDLGLAFYFNYAAYGTILRDSLIYGFEKAGYCGRAYVTNLEHPMLYSCLYGVQMDTPNGSVVNNSDSGDIGSAVLSQIGWGYYFKNGEGCLVSGGSIGNGAYNVPVISDGCKPVQVTGIYAEAHKVELFQAINGGIIYADGLYSKESTFRFGTVATSGKIFINNLYHRNTTVVTPWIVNGDNTGSWWIKNSFDGDTNAYDADKYGIGTARYEVPHFTQSTSPILATEQRGIKAIPDNTATSIFKIRTLADGSDTDVQVGLTVDYFLAGDFGSGGAVSEKGLLEIAIHHRQTLAPVTALTKVGVTQATVVGSTRTVTFTATSTLVATNTYETFIQITSVASNAAKLSFKSPVLPAMPQQVV